MSFTNVLRLFCLTITFAWFTTSATAACPGCCSGHGGISNICSTNGNVICADGTTSPSCNCSACGVAPPAPSTYSATVSFLGVGGGGSITSTVGHSCASRNGICIVSGLRPATTIAFTATPDASSRFVAWGGACSGTNPICQANLNVSSISVTATFEKLAVATGLVVEYRNTADFPGDPGGHFFYSSDTSEQQFVDGGGAGRWSRTGRSFKTGGFSALCRFYGSVSPGPNSHFFTIDSGECTALRAQQVTPKPTDRQQWNYEGFGFSMTPQSTVSGASQCPSGTAPVYRAYNNAYPPSGPKNKWDSNHRFSSNASDIDEVVALGWRSEGVVFCAPL